MKLSLLPKRKKIILFDNQTCQSLKKLFKKNSYFILHCRKEKVYPLFAIFSLFEKFILKQKVPLNVLYYKNLINFIKPIACCTNQDSLRVFYEIQDYCSYTSFFAFQQGLKDLLTEKHNQIKGNYFCLNENYQRYLNKNHKNASFFCTGSLSANLTKIKKPSHNKIAYISNINHYSLDQIIYKKINYGQYILPSNYCNLQILKQVAEELNTTLVIISRSWREINKLEKNKLLEAEKKYFFNILGKKIKIETKNSYLTSQKYKLIISDNSSLGYELFGLGHKVFFMHLQSYFLLKKCSRFNWPAKNKSFGPFWANEFNFVKIKKLIKKLWFMRNKKWLNINNQYKKIVSVYDKNAKNLKDTMQKIRPNLKPYLR